MLIFTASYMCVYIYILSAKAAHVGDDKIHDNRIEVPEDCYGRTCKRE